jgi:prepilin-type N-terminal cleavage/methylation domain-containing protein
MHCIDNSSVIKTGAAELRIALFSGVARKVQHFTASKCGAIQGNERDQNPVHSKRSKAGFSLVEAIVVVAIIVVIASVAIIQMGPVVSNARVDSAAAFVLNVMRHTRERAIDERREYQVTFVSNATIPFATMNVFQGNIVATKAGPTLTFTADSTLTLPWDMRFMVPNPAPPAAPDGQLCGQGSAINFSVTGAACAASTTLTFHPDGSITSGLGGYADGVIYMGRPGQPLATRAVSFFGATGRTKGYRMINNGAGAWAWSIQ